MRRFFRTEPAPKPATSSRQGHVDVLTGQQVSGWAHDGAQPDESVFVDVTVNAERVARVKACLFRDDLRKLGYGDGRKGFAFVPSSYLRPGENHVRVSYANTEDVLPNGERVVLHVVGLDAATHGEADLFELSQVRWKADEEETRLTWGCMMTGDSFVDVVQRHRTLAGGDAILEIGPGYGRILDTFLQRGIPFARYVGLELSAARVERLSLRFTAPGISFVQGDILRDTIDVRPDVVVCSSTFEHLFPSIAKALCNIQAMSAPRAMLFIDFIESDGDDELRTSHAYFENTTAYIRIYARAELERLFAEASFRIRGIERIVLGQDPSGKDVRRALVVAEPAR